MKKSNTTSVDTRLNTSSGGGSQATANNGNARHEDSKEASSNFAFGCINYIMLCVSVVIVIIGLVLMSGGSSTPEAYDPEIFNAMHIKVAPIVTFIGFVSIIIAVMYKPKNTGVSQS